MSHTLVVIPDAWAIVNKEPGSDDLSIPVFPIGFMLPFDSDKRIIVFMPTPEDVLAFCEELILKTRQAMARAAAKPPSLAS